MVQAISFLIGLRGLTALLGQVFLIAALGRLGSEIVSVLVSLRFKGKRGLILLLFYREISKCLVRDLFMSRELGVGCIHLVASRL